MEVSGIEGNFRTTCENVMRVLRSNKESVTAMLEAFVHDPLINWRLLNNAEAAAEAPATSIVRSELDGGRGDVGGGVGREVWGGVRSCRPRSGQADWWRGLCAASSSAGAEVVDCGRE
eukprot:76381-Chlamydomonas_euryale.AAC.1